MAVRHLSATLAQGKAASRSTRRGQRVQMFFRESTIGRLGSHCIAVRVGEVLDLEQGLVGAGGRVHVAHPARPLHLPNRPLPSSSLYTTTPPFPHADVRSSYQLLPCSGSLSSLRLAPFNLHPRPSTTHAESIASLLLPTSEVISRSSFVTRSAAPFDLTTLVYYPYLLPRYERQSGNGGSRIPSTR